MGWTVKSHNFDIILRFSNARTMRSVTTSRKDFQRRASLYCNELYMDDVPGGYDSVDDGVEILTQIKGFFGTMQTKVHKINTV